jgi:hypothetical protein
MTTHLSTTPRLLLATTGLLAFALVHPQARAAGSAVGEIPVKAEPAKTEATQAEPAQPAKEADDQQTKVKIERGAGGRKIYKIEGEIVIEGRIQKPEAFYVLQKSSINYDWHELKKDFVPKILDSVTKAPF